MPWFKPFEKDDWGYKTVHFGQSIGPMVQEGEQRIRWPDGHVEKLQVEMRPYQTTVSEQGGRPETVRGSIPYLIIPYHGSRVEVPLTEAGVKVWRR